MGSKTRHEFQHSDAPTWCIHCGVFDRNTTARERCDADRTAKFDTRTVAGFETVAKIATGRKTDEEMPKLAE
jgi:hypothetical protein